MGVGRTINAVIPARIGSKRVHKKNIALVGNHPLIAYSIIACLRSSKINRVVVSTDSEQIAQIATEYGAEVPFLRPKEYATDLSSDYGFLKHFFDNIGGEDVALIRPTTPHRNPNELDKIIHTYFSLDHNITGLRTVNICDTSPYKLYSIDNNMCSCFFNDFNGISDYSNLPNQVFPKTYSPNGYIDIVKHDTINIGSMFGDKIFGVVTQKIIDVDSQFDLDLVNMQVGTKYDYINIKYRGKE